MAHMENQNLFSRAKRQVYSSRPQFLQADQPPPDGSCGPLVFNNSAGIELNVKPDAFEYGGDFGHGGASPPQLGGPQR